MKSFFGGIWGIPLVSSIGYVCVYIYNMAYLKYFDIPIHVANILLEDFFGLGLFVICVFVMLFLLLREDIIEKNSLESLNPITTAKITWLLIIPFMILLALSYLLPDKKWHLAFAFFFLVEFFCFTYRFLSSEKIDVVSWSNLIFSFLLSIGVAYSFGLGAASQQSDFVGVKVPETSNKYYLLIKRNAGSEGLFKIYDKDKKEWENGFYILNIDNKYYTKQITVRNEINKLDKKQSDQ